MNLFRFENAMALQWLWAVPLLALVFYLSHRYSQKAIQKVIGSKLVPYLTSSVSLVKSRWKWVLQLMVIALMIIALARPQDGQSQGKAKSEGVEVMFLVDVSRSMMAEDIKPSRLELAKKELTRFLDLGGGDRIGLIAFAGSSITLSPLTGDKAALKMYLDSLSPQAVSTQGTEFRKALLEAKGAFQRGGDEDNEKTVVTRVVVIASDGEDNEEGALKVAEELKSQGVRIFTLGFGTQKGGPIPIRDQQGNLKGYRKDKKGKVVLTQTHGTILRNLAQTGGGSFYHVTFGGNSIHQLRDDLDRLEKAQFDSSEITTYNERYQIYLGLALFLGVIELLLHRRKRLGRIWKGRFEVAEA